MGATNGAPAEPPPRPAVPPLAVLALPPLARVPPLPASASVGGALVDPELPPTVGSVSTTERSPPATAASEEGAVGAEVGAPPPAAAASPPSEGEEDDDELAALPVVTREPAPPLVV